MKLLYKLILTSLGTTAIALPTVGYFTTLSKYNTQEDEYKKELEKFKIETEELKNGNVEAEKAKEEINKIKTTIPVGIQKLKGFIEGSVFKYSSIYNDLKRTMNEIEEGLKFEE